MKRNPGYRTRKVTFSGSKLPHTNSTMKTLQQHFQQASDRPLAFNEAQLRTMLAQHDMALPQTSRIPDATSIATRALRVVGVGVALAGLGTFAIQSSGELAPTRSGAVAALPAPTVKRMPAAVTAPEPTSAVERSTVIEPSAPATRASDGRRFIQGLSGMTPVQPLPVPATAMLSAVDPAEQASLGLNRLSDGSIAWSYSLATSDGSSEESILANMTDSLVVKTLDANGTGDRLISRAAFPLSIVTRAKSPIGSSWQIVTDETGRLLEERISVSDGDQLRYISSLFARGASTDGVAEKIDNVRGLDVVGRSLQLNTLIPIRINVGPDADGGIFWCRPDAQLIAQLPARTVAQLRSELEKAASVVGTRDTLALVRRGWALSVLATIDSIRPEQLKIESDVDMVAQGMTGAEIFAGSRRNAGAVARFEAVRNPATGSATFDLELNQARRVTVTLHDVNGRRIKTLAATQSFDEGASQITASLDGVERGLYLVSIATDIREQVVQRLVVE